jgi:SAM-dependent methyltransferase
VTSSRPKEAAAWDAEYAAGRYRDEPPIGFVDDILTVARRQGLSDGLYIGCGNGRNYLPLVQGGLDLVGLDISATAIHQVASAMPDRTDRLVVGDLSTIPDEERFGILVGIQVFQHGTRQEAVGHVRQAQERLVPGGIFCLRVNATSTQVHYKHSVVEQSPDGSYTVRYQAGPKAGLDIHFFTRGALEELFDGFQPVIPLRLDITRRVPPETGTWSQWEAIWRLPDEAYSDFS